MVYVADGCNWIELEKSLQFESRFGTLDGGVAYILHIVSYVF